MCKPCAGGIHALAIWSIVARYCVISGSTSLASLRSDLPAEITRISRNDIRHALLFDIHFGAGCDCLHAHRDFHFARQVGIAEAVRV